MELHFDAMLHTSWVTKILMRAISNVHAGRRFPTPALQYVVLRQRVELKICYFVGQLCSGERRSATISGTRVWCYSLLQCH